MHGRLAGHLQWRCIVCYLEAEGVEGQVVGRGGHVEVEHGEAEALQRHHHPQQLPGPPRREHLHVGVALRHGHLDVGHAAAGPRAAAATLIAASRARTVASADSTGRAGRVLREREEAGERRRRRRLGAARPPLLRLQRLQQLLQLLDEVDGARHDRRLVALHAVVPINKRYVAKGTCHPVATKSLAHKKVRLLMRGAVARYAIARDSVTDATKAEWRGEAAAAADGQGATRFDVRYSKSWGGSSNQQYGECQAVRAHAW
jgi:hypothetical protein